MGFNADARAHMFWIIALACAAFEQTCSTLAAASPTGTAEMERKRAGFARSLSRLIGEAVLPLPL
jgi:hypothetical protein